MTDRSTAQRAELDQASTRPYKTTMRFLKMVET